MRVGSENRTFTGVQTYQVNYTIRGLIAPQQAQSGLDEFNWNAVGNGWEVPIDGAEVTVDRAGGGHPGRLLLRLRASPSPAQAHASPAPPRPSRPTGVGNGSGVQVIAGFPAGTFTGAEARHRAPLHASATCSRSPRSTGGRDRGALRARPGGPVPPDAPRRARPGVPRASRPASCRRPNQEVSVGYQTQDVAGRRAVHAAAGRPSR